MAASKGTIILTGANGNLGSAIVAKIVSTPEFAAYHGIYTVRNAGSSPALDHALRASRASRAHSHDVISLDLTDLTSIRETAATINARVGRAEIPPIRALILNAGWTEFTTQTWTQDGFDMAFKANYLGHWLLTMLLLQSMDRESGKIVVIGSLAHDSQARQNDAQFKDPKWKVIFQDSTEPVAKGTWSTTKDDQSWCAGFRRYAAAKICELMMIGELQRRLDTDPILNKISVVGIDPDFSSMCRFSSVALSQRSSPYDPKVSWNILTASFDPSPNKGLYFDGSVRAEMSAEARDTAKQSLLWRDTIEYTSLQAGESALTKWA